MSEKQDLAGAWSKLCRRWRWGISLMWLCICGCGFVWGMKFMQVTSLEYPPPKGSPSYKGQEALATFFPSLVSDKTDFISLRSRDGSSIVADKYRFSFAQLATDLQASMQERFPALNVRVTSWYMVEPFAPVLAKQMLSADKIMTLMPFTFSTPPNKVVQAELLEFAQSETVRLVDKAGLGSQVMVGIIGFRTIATAIYKGVEADTGKMETMVLPLAFTVLAYAIGTVGLMAIALTVLPAILLTQFLIMYPIAISTFIISFTPSVMLSVTLGVGLDHILFLLTRFKNGIQDGMDVADAVELMLRSAGYTVVVSGATLLVAFLGMMVLPMSMIRSMGMGLAVTVTSAMLVNLTLLPALTFILGEKMLKVDAYLYGRWQSLKDRIRGVRRGDSQGSAEAGAPAALPFKDEKKAEDAQEMREEPTGIARPGAPASANGGISGGCWRWIADFLTEGPWWRAMAVLVVVLALLAPAVVQCFNLKSNVDLHQNLSKKDPAVHTYDIVLKSFGAGVIPYRVILVDESGKLPSKGFLSPEGYAAMTTVMQGFIDKVPPTTLDEFQGLAALDGKWITYDEMAAALSAAPVPGSLDLELQQLAKGADSIRKVTEDGRVTYFTITQKHLDPNLEEGGQWLKVAQREIASMASDLGLGLYIQGEVANMHDSNAGLLRVFPAMIGGTFAAIFVLMALAFRSIAAPLRSVFTIALTCSFTYGLAVAVYQGGILNWLGVYFLEKTGSLCFVPVFGCGSVIMGLALDYDVFLVTRVLEYRLEGETDLNSIKKGVVSTGNIITAAGMIMAVAFSGLMLSSAMVLSQIGFIFVAAVLLDTFVMRTTVVPLLMRFSGKYAWWPRTDLPPTSDLPTKAPMAKLNGAT